MDNISKRNDYNSLKKEYLYLKNLLEEESDDKNKRLINNRLYLIEDRIVDYLAEYAKYLSEYDDFDERGKNLLLNFRSIINKYLIKENGQEYWQEVLDTALKIEIY
jgi:hypothetical protein